MYGGEYHFLRAFHSCPGNPAVNRKDENPDYQRHGGGGNPCRDYDWDDDASGRKIQPLLLCVFYRIILADSVHTEPVLRAPLSEVSPGSGQNLPAACSCIGGYGGGGLWRVSGAVLSLQDKYRGAGGSSFCRSNGLFRTDYTLESGVGSGAYRDAQGPYAGGDCQKAEDSETGGG